MTRIYLIRHAEAEGNLYRLAHGHYNSSLTPRGYRQLAYLRRRFRDIHIDAVYGSDLLRTQATASAIYADKNLPFHPMPLLREVCLGWWDPLSWGEVARRDRAMYDHYNQRPHLFHVDGGETFPQVQERMIEGLRQIARENPGASVAATSHAAAIRATLGRIKNISLEEIGSTTYSGNTGVTLLEVDGDDIRVVFERDSSHLPDSEVTKRRVRPGAIATATAPGFWYQSRQETADSCSLEAFLDDTYAGRIAMAVEPDALRITEYEIAPALRGQRYGMQPIGQAIQYARAQNRDFVTLTCGEDVSGFFGKYGFRETGRSGGGIDLTLDVRRIIREIPEL